VAIAAFFIWRCDSQLAAGALPQIQQKEVLQEFRLFLRRDARKFVGAILLCLLLLGGPCLGCGQSWTTTFSSKRKKP
jgi:hypothetical protein